MKTRTGELVFWALVATVVVLLEITACSMVRAADRGFFNCFHLTDGQKDWFKLPGISNCCDLSDGMPIRFEDRPDGTYIPPFDIAEPEATSCRDNPDLPFTKDEPGDDKKEDRSSWVRVPDSVILKRNNPIGVGVVWWVNAGYPAPDIGHDVRCFVGLPKV